jgi:hypothetical protein
MLGQQLHRITPHSLIAPVLRLRTVWAMQKKTGVAPGKWCDAVAELVAAADRAEQARSGADGRWWGIWSDFCYRRARSELQATPELLLEWVQSEGVSRWAHTTVERVVDTVLERHEQAGFSLVLEVQQ